MCKNIVALGLILNWWLVCSPTAWAQKKDEPKIESASASDYKALLQSKGMIGTLTALDVKAASLGVRVDFATLESNPHYKPDHAATKFQQQLQGLYRQQQHAQNIKNASQRQERLNRLAQQIQQLQLRLAQHAARDADPNNPNGPVKVNHHYKDFDLPCADKVEIRRMILPVEYDDKGNIKTHSNDELAGLRGDDASKPGFKAKMEDLHSGQVVRLYFAPLKSDDARKDESKKTESDKETKGEKNANANSGNKNDADGTPRERPTVSMIVILQDTSADAAPSSKKTE